MTERKIIITDDDNPADKFTHSTCVCKVCEGMKTSSKEWDEFSPKNNLQRRMKDVVDRIEAREAAKMTSEAAKMTSEAAKMTSEAAKMTSEARDEQVASRPKKRTRR